MIAVLAFDVEGRLRGGALDTAPGVQRLMRIWVEKELRVERWDVLELHSMLKNGALPSSRPV